jgi:hypothetical protein
MCVQALKGIEKSLSGITMEPISISYQDLKDAFDDRTSRPPEELLELIAKAFGPDGLGLLEVSNIPPAVVKLRSNVLDMAETLAMLPKEQLEEITIPSSMYSIGWSHGKEQFRGEYDTGKGRTSTKACNTQPPSTTPHDQKHSGGRN